uniref:Uncharacterized protein n=1 Tax=Acrobeloides nanus TaxID=290746 RepID=A0A914C0K4_9BILA
MRAADINDIEKNIPPMTSQISVSSQIYVANNKTNEVVLNVTEIQLCTSLPKKKRFMNDYFVFDWGSSVVPEWGSSVEAALVVRSTIVDEGSVMTGV